MSPSTMLRRFLLGTIVLPSTLLAQARDLGPLVRRVFARWDSTTGPGCSVGIDRAGQPRFTRAFGKADLEYDIPNKPETIFEAGSISKQFTAAATVLLAIDGKLDLSDDVRKYVPELPAYERPITIRHLLNHTSGLRDWGEIADLAGWPRGSRVHTHDHVLDILRRQRALNYPPGDKYSYTNSGYNLLAIIVSRVSGQPFATFSRERIFKPLGLTSTQWRDDYRRIVKGRAQAYERTGGHWELEMPFENVHGNGGLLTTVSDLLTWTAMLEHPTRAWKPLVDSLHVRGILTKGDTITYALGLVVSDYRGVPMVEHSGSTAGYRAELRRFPGRGLAIAVLCNAANANPVALATQLSDSLLGSALGPVAARPQRPRADTAMALSPSILTDYVGTYYSPDVETALDVSVKDGNVVLSRRPAMQVTLHPIVTDAFGGFNDRVWFTRDAARRVTALHVASGRAYDVVFERRTVTVNLSGANGASVGTATLSSDPGGVKITLAVSGLTAGEHAIHIHRTPQCEAPSFNSAGGHFNPDGKQHGLNNPQGPHAGDMPNFTVDASGRSTATVLAQGVTLDEGPHSVFTNGGTALVIHEAPDDLTTDPTGNAGARIACGVIKKS